MLRNLVWAVTITTCLAEPRIIRPCLLHDLRCIQDNLVVNSQCKPGPIRAIPTIRVRPSFRFECPYFHSSYIDDNLVVTNLDSCVVSEFFFNLDTDKAVLAIDCPNVGLESDRTVLQHRSLHEDSIYHYHINSTYPILRLTTNLNRADQIRFCDEFTFVEVPVLPVHHINPKDKRTANFLTRDNKELYIFERESFSYRGVHIMNHVMKHKLCDFRCSYDLVPFSEGF